MPTLQLIITDAGRQAIVDAQNTGTLPVVLDQFALGTGKWTPDATATALQTELKRINTVGGLAVAEDTIHVTCTDDSTDAYALGEFGLYTDGGVLFAIYSEVAGITDKAADALLLLASDVVLTSVPPGAVTVNGIGFSNPPATEAAPGIAEIATQVEADTATDDDRIMTPKKAKGSAAVYQYTVNQALATPANTGTIAQLVSWLAGRLMAITGKTDWKTTPATTLEATKTHIDSTAPHSATSAATANRLMLRDASGRAKVAAPSASDDIARKDTVDALLPSGTIMLFAQTAAPTGWTKLTNHDNKALRVVSGTAGSGGTVAFTTAFASRSVSSVTAGGTVGSTTLTTPQIPSHNHGSPVFYVAAGGSNAMAAGSTFAAQTNNEGGGGGHSHSFTGIGHNHTLDMAVQYVDVIRAQKG